MGRRRRRRRKRKKRRTRRKKGRKKQGRRKFILRIVRIEGGRWMKTQPHMYYIKYTPMAVCCISPLRTPLSNSINSDNYFSDILIIFNELVSLAHVLPREDLPDDGLKCAVGEQGRGECCEVGNEAGLILAIPHS